jgi:hypothetical protein
MNHQHYKKSLHLSFYEELSGAEKSGLDDHLRRCPECQAELEKLQKLHETLARAGAFTPDEALLHESRKELRAHLRSERNRPSFLDRLSDFAEQYLLPNYKVAFGGAVMLAAGILVGRFFFSPAQQSDRITEQPVPDPKLASFEGEPRITNIRFLDPDASDGMVEFTFDAMTQVHMKGSINDERIQKMLAHALVNDQNPGVRLRSVSAFSTQSERLRLPDREVKAALILAATSDKNPAVRKEALKTLKSFPFDEEIKQTYLHVLMQDDNAALRIAAINSLDSARTETYDAALLDVLKQRMQSDDNSYVRIRAKAVLEEIKQQ